MLDAVELVAVLEVVVVVKTGGFGTYGSSVDEDKADVVVVV